LVPPRAAPETTSLFEARLSAPVPLLDRYMTSCSGLLMPLRVISWLVMICSGSALLFGSWRMREPVTMIAPSLAPRSPSASVCGSAPVGVAASGVVSCANATPGIASASAANADPETSIILSDV